MAKKNLVYQRVEDDGNTLERVDPQELARALGADEIAASVDKGSPFAMSALRSRLLSDIVSTGGRPGRREATLRKIPVTESEWAALDSISNLLRKEGVSTTPGQVAGVLLHHSLVQVLRRLDSVIPSRESHSGSARTLANVDLEETLDNVLAAAAKAQVHLEELKPVALELLRQMRDSSGDDGDDR